jgi:hypothetical protein
VADHEVEVATDTDRTLANRLLGFIRPFVYLLRIAFSPR